MALIRLIQEAGAVPNSPILSLKAYDPEVENTKQVLKEKDVIIDNNNERIQELENYVAELNERCGVLEEELNNQMDTNKQQESEMPVVIKNYERFISDITANYAALKQERNMTAIHLANLEMAFADLVEKYERLKNVVIGYQQNQEVLLGQLEMYEDAIKILQERYDNFKKYANERLTKANAHVEQIDKKHISEMAKVKSKVLQSKVRISELEKSMSIMTTSANIGDGRVVDGNNKSMFAPLATYFSFQ